MRAFTPSEKGVFAVSLALVGVTFVQYMLLDPSDPDESKATLRYWGQIPANVGLVGLSSLGIRSALKVAPPDRAGVLLLALGIAGFALGGWMWAFYNLTGVDVPFPSLADVGYLGLSVSAISGLGLLFFRNRRRRLQGVDLAIAVAFPLAVLALFWAFLVAGRSEGAESTLAALVSLAYPTGDALYVALAGLVLYFSRPTPLTPALRRFAGALLLMAVTDVVFILGVDDGTYFTGGWIDQLYWISISAYAVAVLLFRPASPEAAPRAAGGVEAVRE